MRTGKARLLTLSVVSVVVLALLPISCVLYRNGLRASEKLPPDTPVTRVPSLSDVAYGPDPANRLDVYLPTVPQIGVIVYFHAGGWCCGDKSQIDTLILSEVDSGYAVVAANFRSSFAASAKQMLADADRVVRYTRVNRARWGAGQGKVLASGGSAGGNIALLLGGAPGVFTGQNLPADLAAADPHVDGVISLVGPSDLRPYLAGEVPVAGFDGQALAEDFLDCSDGGRVEAGRLMPPCDQATVLRYSPLFWAVITAMFGGGLPPVYLAHGRLDVLVPPETQAVPLAAWWQLSAGFPATWLDISPWAGHNLTFDVDKAAFDLWLRLFASP
jgi:acetyl esterase/lipase